MEELAHDGLQIAMPDPTLTDEAGRLAALHRYDILDTPAEPAFDKITRLARAITGAPISVVSLIDTDRQWFKSRDGLAASETPRDIAFCDHAIRHRQPMIIPDALRDARFRDNPLVTAGPGIRSYIGIPLETPDGYNIGSLCAIDTVPRAFTPEQVGMMETLASLVVDQLELRRIADRDFLSGALTRRAFLAEIDRSVALFARHRRPASLLLCDIDHFKQINDSYGHAAGDRVIRAVADLCAGLKRPSDCIGRLGGEEFGMLLPETGEREAAGVAQRLCEAIGASLIGEDPVLRVTASFGVAEIADDRATSQRWLATADAALYRAKQAGRNRICVAGPPA